MNEVQFRRFDPSIASYSKKTLKHILSGKSKGYCKYVADVSDRFALIQFSDSVKAAYLTSNNSIRFFTVKLDWSTWRNSEERRYSDPYYFFEAKKVSVLDENADSVPLNIKLYYVNGKGYPSPSFCPDLTEESNDIKWINLRPKLGTFEKKVLKKEHPEIKNDMCIKMRNIRQNLDVYVKNTSELEDSKIEELVAPTRDVTGYNLRIFRKENLLPYRLGIKR